MNRLSLYDVISLKRYIIHLKWNIVEYAISLRLLFLAKYHGGRLKLSCIFGDIFKTIFAFF